jgi:hypothetical protein
MANHDSVKRKQMRWIGAALTAPAFSLFVYAFVSINGWYMAMVSVSVFAAVVAFAIGLTMFIQSLD